MAQGSAYKQGQAWLVFELETNLEYQVKNIFTTEGGYYTDQGDIIVTHVVVFYTKIMKFM